MSDTPETDAHAPFRYGITTHGVTTYYIPADFARKLERERYEAREALSLIAEDCDSWLAGECDDPSAEFIKAVRDYARAMQP
jgi:hypothetical protein